MRFQNLAICGSMISTNKRNGPNIFTYSHISFICACRGGYPLWLMF